jgi:hypothetical protein
MPTDDPHGTKVLDDLARIKKAVEWLYDQVPEHILTDPENEEQLELVEKFIGKWGKWRHF